MSRLIDADELLKRIPITHADELQNCRNCSLLCDWEVEDLVDDAPTIEPQTTTWLNSYSPYQCEKCGFHVDSKTRYCPECGRRANNYD